MQNVIFFMKAFSF